MITFKVSDVTHDPTSFPLQNLHDALAERGVHTTEAVSPSPALVKCEPYHGLLMATHMAYAHHLPLTLSPDHIWLCIAQAAARHILLHAESSRERWVQHQGRLALEVRRDTFAPGSPENDWSGAIAEFSDQIHAHIGGRHALLVSDFSTTGAAQRTASEIVLMSGMQKYFIYVVRTLCGIPEITLEGTPADWSAIVDRARALDVLGADAWLAQLIPVLEAIASTSRGDIDTAFWERFYKHVGGSGGSHVSGWINVLFPYLGDDITVEKRNIMAFNPDEDPFCAPKLNGFPLGLSRAPFTWQYLSETRPMQCLAGFVGVTQDPQSLALRPQIAWAIAPDQGARTFICTINAFTAEGSAPTITAKPTNPGALTSLERLGVEIVDLDRFDVSLRGCAELTSLAGIGGAPGLRYADVWKCHALESLEGIEEARDLKKLEVVGCQGLVNLAGLEHHAALTDVHLAWCDSLSDISPLASLTQLERCRINRCRELSDLSPLASLPNLKRLSLKSCPGVPAEAEGDHEGREAVERVLALIAKR